MDVKRFLLCFCIFSSFIIASQADCTLNIQESPPIIVKDIGSKRVILNKRAGSIRLREGEIISAHCSTNMKLRSDYNNYEDTIRSVQLQCNANMRISYKTPDKQSFKQIDRETVYISCSKSVSPELYESNATLPSCEKLSTYAIGVGKLPGLKDIVMAGICYDLTSLTFKYATYLAYRPKNEFVTTKNILQPAVTLDIKLSNLDGYFSFMSQNLFDTSFNQLKKSEQFLSVIDFDFVSLIQDAPLQNELKSYENMLNVAWWRNLRLANWRSFLKAFEERTQAVKYLVYAGTSGELEMPPSSDSCNQAAKLQIEADGLIVKPPRYIWYYLKSLHKNISENFVVIADNSPYVLYDRRSINSTIFCNDMCDQIDWLRTSSFAQTRLMPSMGLVFCCHPKDVGKQLTNLPHMTAKPLAVTQASTPTTTASTTTTTEPSTDLEYDQLYI